MKKGPPPLSLSSLHISNQGISHRTIQIQDVRVKLPNSELFKFDGDIINWRGFWDQFLIAIHENDSLAYPSDSVRMHENMDQKKLRIGHISNSTVFL